MDPSCINLNFVLTYLDKSCTLDGSAAVSDGLYDPSFSYDAIAEYITDTTLWKEIFQIQINDYIVNEPQTNDVKYCVNSTSLESLFQLIRDYPLGEHAIVTNNTAIGRNTILSSPYANQCIDHDYVRYLAKSLFNTEYATSLFLNRVPLLNSIGNAVKLAWFEMYNILKNISDTGNNMNLLGSTGFKYLTNATTTTDNICRELYLQLISQIPERFQALQNITTSQPLPLLRGDTICVRVTINPCLTQQTFGGPPLKPRIYIIKFILS